MNKKEIKKELLGTVKRKFGISHNLQDTEINDLISEAFDEYLLITGDDSVKEIYISVIKGVVSKRYVRGRDVGVKSISVDGLSVSYSDIGDFEEYYGLLRVNYSLTVDEEVRFI